MILRSSAGDLRSEAGGWALLRESRECYMETLVRNGGFSSGTSVKFRQLAGRN